MDESSQHDATVVARSRLYGARRAGILPDVAILRNLGSSQQFLLGAQNLIGRLGSATIQLPRRHISGEHARIVWLDGRWVLRDLGSTNGTYLNNKRILPGSDYPLHEGAQLAFGALQELWVLEEIDPPVLHARPLNGGEARLAENELLALPDEDAPHTVLFRGADGLWCLETDGERRLVSDREIVVVANTAWQLFLPTEAGGTWEASATPPTTLAMRFRVSLDEEYVELSIHEHGAVHEMGARQHHYMLLLLARLRIRDAAEGIPAAEQGWMYRDDLLRGLRITSRKLNMYVFRARTIFARFGIRSDTVIERRQNTGQIRLGISDLAEQTLA